MPAGSKGVADNDEDNDDDDFFGIQDDDDTLNDQQLQKYDTMHQADINHHKVQYYTIGYHMGYDEEYNATTTSTPSPPPPSTNENIHNSDELPTVSSTTNENNTTSSKTTTGSNRMLQNGFDDGYMDTYEVTKEIGYILGKHIFASQINILSSLSKSTITNLDDNKGMNSAYKSDDDINDNNNNHSLQRIENDSNNNSHHDDTTGNMKKPMMKIKNNKINNNNEISKVLVIDPDDLQLAKEFLNCCVNLQKEKDVNKSSKTYPIMSSQSTPPLIHDKNKNTNNKNTASYENSLNNDMDEEVQQQQQQLDDGTSVVDGTSSSEATKMESETKLLFRKSNVPIQLKELLGTAHKK